MKDMKIALALGVFLTLLSIGACMVMPSSLSTPVSTEARFAPHVITMRQYASLAVGMSTAEATRILGRPGQELSRSQFGNLETVMYQWTNPGGGNVILMFQNDQLIQRSQFGLPGGAR